MGFSSLQLLSCWSGSVSYTHLDVYKRQILPGERRIVPLLQEATPEPTALPAPTPDPALEAQPWQAWWRLLTDAPQPTR